MSDSVLVAVAEGVGTLTLNRPDKLNAWDTPMRQEISARLAELNADDAVRVIVLTGAGERAFSAGQDLGETKEFASAEEGHAWFLTWRAFYDSLRGLDKAVVASLNGVAAGSAFQFAMLCDIRIGHAGSNMGQPEINAGIPSVLGPMLMQPRIGLSRTIELTLSGRMMDGEECHRIGLIHHLVSREQVPAKTDEVAAMLAEKPPIAMKLNKRRFRDMTQPAFDEAFDAGWRIQSEAFGSGEPQAMMRRFFEERAAKKR